MRNSRREAEPAGPGAKVQRERAGELLREWWHDLDTNGEERVLRPWGLPRRWGR